MDNFFYTYEHFKQKYFDIVNRYKIKSEYIVYVPKNKQFKDSINLNDINNCTVILDSCSSLLIIDTRNKLKHKERNITIFVEENAQLIYIDDQQLYTDQEEETTISFYANKNSLINYFTVQTGGLCVKTNLSFMLQGSGAEISADGVSLLSEQQKNKFYTLQCHKEDKTFSRLSIKGCYTDSSYGFYKGSVVIDHKASNADASQKNKVFLLSEKAKAESIPCLEVLQNKVKCAHGSAIGYLNEDELYFLSSRGINKNIAKKMLLQGFALSFIKKIKNEKLKHYVYQRIEKKLQEMV